MPSTHIQHRTLYMQHARTLNTHPASSTVTLCTEGYVCLVCTDMYTLLKDYLMLYNIYTSFCVYPDNMISGIIVAMYIHTGGCV